MIKIYQTEKWKLFNEELQKKHNLMMKNSSLQFELKKRKGNDQETDHLQTVKNHYTNIFCKKS